MPIIGIATDAVQKARQRVLDIGVNGYITKPVNRDLLIENIKRYNDSILKIAYISIKIAKGFSFFNVKQGFVNQFNYIFYIISMNHFNRSVHIS